MEDTETPSVSRRAALAGATTALAASAGCVQRLRTVVGDDSSEQLVVGITMPAADYDPFAAPIARHLIDGLTAAGIDYRLRPVPQDELSRQVLLANDFDIYIARLPYDRRPDPDVLYPLLHSRFRGEGGWQNPFGFTNVECDDLLDEQRRTSGERRRRAVADLQRLLGRTQPFVPLVRPTIISGVRTGRFSGWERAVQHPPQGLLALERGDVSDGDRSAAVASTDDETADRLRLGSTDVRITENRNPISATHSHESSLVELLYDPLAVAHGERVEPWLAGEITWQSSADGSTAADTDGETGTRTIRVRLREDLTWHDGEALTADDIAFSYAFLDDTALGEAPTPIPAPRFRGAVTLVEDVTVLDERTARLTLTESTRAVAERALTVPLFPRHIWNERTETVSVAGVELDTETTDALVWDNPEPVGSGPLRFESATAEDRVVVSRFEEHFLARPAPPASVAGLTAPAFAALTVEMSSSSPNLVESLQAADIDATFSPVAPAAATRIGDDESLSLVSAPSYASYHLGFNTRIEPFSDPNFRRTLARLCDKGWLAAAVFSGYGDPIASPLADTDWLADDVRWAGTDPAAPFLGTDGEIDPADARAAFRDIGYRYNGDGELVV